MKKIISLIIVVLSFIQLQAQLNMINYGTPNGFEVATDLVVLPDDSKVIVGYKYTAQTTDSVNAKNAIIFKVDASDNFVWGYEFSSVKSDEIKVKLANDGNIFFYGWLGAEWNDYSTLTGFVGKIDQNNGSVLWEREVNTTDGIGNTQIQALLELSSGNVIIGGRNYSQWNSHCPHGGTDAFEATTASKNFLVKMDHLGNFINADLNSYPGTHDCKASSIVEILQYTPDSLIIIGGQQNGVSPIEHGDGFIIKMDTNYNVANVNRLNVNFNENGWNGNNNWFKDMHIVNNKLVGINGVHGPQWTHGFSRGAIVKFDIPSFTLEYIKVIKSNATNSSFYSFAPINENEFYYTQASSPQYYSYNSTSLNVGSAQSYITKLNDTTILATKTLDAPGNKGFNKIKFHNNNLYGVGFTHFGNNQIGNQDVFIVQTDTNFTSFEECTFVDSNEVWLVDPVSWAFSPITSVSHTYTVSLDPPATTKTEINFSSIFQMDTFSSRNECVCIYRDTTEMNCVSFPLIVANGTIINSLGLYEIDTFSSLILCDTVYYADIISSDNILPIVQCKNDTIYLNENGLASLDSSNVIDSFYAACGINQVYISQENFKCKDEGDNPVTLYVEDNSGNIDSCTSIVTVLDTFKYIYIDTTICQEDTLSIMGFDYYETGIYNDTIFGSDNIFPKFSTGTPVPVSSSTNNAYGNSPAALYSNYTNQGAAIGNVATGFSFQYLTNPFWTGNGVSANTLVNILGYWGTGVPDYTWFGASFPIDVPVSKTYHIVLAADNLFRFSLDGNILISSSGAAIRAAGQPTGNNSQASFIRAHIYPIYLTEGCHVIGLQGYNQNNGSSATFGGAILDNDSADLVNATMMSDLNFLFRTDSVDNFYSSVSTLSCPDQAVEIDSAACAECQTCERIIQVNLKVDSVKKIVIDTALCHGESITVNGVNYSTNQTNTIDKLTYLISGCDSVLWDITVNIDIPTTKIIDTTICQGQSLFVNGETYTSNQTNTLDTSFYSVSGCDSIHYDITIKIDSVESIVIDTALCEGQSLLVNGETYTSNQTNTLDTSFYSVSGCDSVHYDITINIDSLEIVVIDTTICEGQSLLMNGETYTSDQTNTLDTAFYTASGCDSVHYDITINIDSLEMVVIDTTICEGQSLFVNGKTYTSDQTNTLDTSFYSVSGCDSVHYDISLQIDSLEIVVIDTTICEGQSLLVNGEIYTSDQTNTLDTAFYNASGCDSVHYDISLQIDSLEMVVIDTTICEGQSLFVNGKTYTSDQTNTLDTAFYSVSGCDSVIYDITINIDSLEMVVIDTTICEGQSLFVNGETYTSDQTNTLDTAFYSVSGCDSVLYDITINIDSFIVDTQKFVFCEGDSAFVNNIKYDSSGIYFDTIQYLNNGCDSIQYVIEVTVNKNYNDTLMVSICETTLPYIFPDGSIHNTASDTIQLSSLVSTYNCDSTIFTYLTVNKVGVISSLPDTIAICDNFYQDFNINSQNIASYQWQLNTGSGYTNLLDGGIYSGTLTNQLTISPLDSLLSGNIYRVEMYDECGFGPFTDETFLRVTLPHNIINPIPDITKCLRDSTLVFIDYNGYNYVWNDGQTGQYFNPNQTSGIYTVNFIEHRTNCIMEEEIEVFIKDCLNDCVVTLPTGFSPGNSIGNNDIFKIITNCSGGFENFEFSIYNRWGELIFRTIDHRYGWDGNYKGEIQELGTYVYVLTYLKKGATKSDSVSGTVTLIH